MLRRLFILRKRGFSKRRRRAVRIIRSFEFPSKSSEKKGDKGVNPDIVASRARVLFEVALHGVSEIDGAFCLISEGLVFFLELGAFFLSEGVESVLH